MFGAYPELSDVCTQIVDFTGVNFRIRVEPLAKEMLVDAIAGYRAARKANRPPNIAFLQGLLARSHELYASRYAAFKGEKYEVWAPFLESIPRLRSDRSLAMSAAMSPRPALMLFPSAAWRSSLPHAS